MSLLDTEDGLVFTGRSGDRERVWLSRDDGRTWSEHGALPSRPRLLITHAGCREIHRIESSPAGLFHVRGLSEQAPRWRITDANPIELYSVAMGSDSRMGTVWIDRGRGWPELMFSQSLDHGETWSPSVRVNTESRGKEMALPVLVSHRGGWVVIWTENRDARTLFDVYGSFSADGQRWEPSRRLNDDQEPAFSVAPNVVEDGEVVHVLAQDYRELNRFHDRDSNIYYARMVLGSSQVARNVRVNDVTDGPQWGAYLYRDAASGVLFAAWLDARHWLTGDVYASTSADGGISWSPNRRVNVNLKPEMMGRPLIARRRAGGAYILWQQTFGSRRQSLFRRISFEEHSDNAGQKDSATPRTAGPAIVPARAQRLILQESFEHGSMGSIQPLSGSWLVHDGCLLSYGYSPSLAELSVPPMQDFLLEGRFRLDPDQHLSSQIFFRVTGAVDGIVDAYHLRNHFRMGVFFSRTRFTLNLEQPGEFIPEPIEDRWLPLRQDVWYSFRLLVQGRRLDYWLDGKWALSAEDLDSRAGRILLGIDGLAPVEWDDLSLYALDTSQDASSR